MNGNRLPWRNVLAREVTESFDGNRLVASSQRLILDCGHTIPETTPGQRRGRCRPCATAGRRPARRRVQAP